MTEIDINAIRKDAARLAQLLGRAGDHPAAVAFRANDLASARVPALCDEVEQWRAAYGETALRDAQKIIAERNELRAKTDELTAEVARLTDALINARATAADRIADRDRICRDVMAERDVARAEADELRGIADAARYEYGDMWCLDGECDHDAPCPMVETRYATAAQILAVEALLMSTDGDALGDEETIPVGEVRRVLGEARQGVSA